MAVFKSKYRELKFYVDGELHAFNSGSFSTDNDKVIAVLSQLKDAQRVDEPKKAEEKPKVATTTRRKTSAK